MQHCIANDRSRWPCLDTNKEPGRVYQPWLSGEVGGIVACEYKSGRPSLTQASRLLEWYVLIDGGHKNIYRGNARQLMRLAILAAAVKRSGTH